MKDIKNGTKYFDVDKEFFVIDSNNLTNVKSKLYGYSVQSCGVIEDKTLTESTASGLNGRGCYVYVKSADGKITIQQDCNGSYGIYLYKYNDYFAISNSFLYLLEHIEMNYPVTLNINYANQLFVSVYASFMATETLVNEIEALDRSAVVSIDINTKKLYIKHIDYEDYKYSLDTMEGVKILDSWFDFWTNLFLGLSKKTNNLSVDLSGGYDSRLAFLLMLNSGVDFNKVRVNSLVDKLHTHGKDFEIASKIASHYGFELNADTSACDCMNYSLADAMDIECYTRMGISKEPFFSTRCRADKELHVAGSGGENIRSYYNVSSEQLLLEVMRPFSNMSFQLQKKLAESFKEIMAHNYSKIADKYSVKWDDPADYKSTYLYRDGQSRCHFGKQMVSKYFSNSIRITPLIDPDLWKLRLDLPDFHDKNFLMVMIYQRYCPELMEFPFDGGRKFATEESIDLAKRINEKFPRMKRERKIVPITFDEKDAQVESVVSRGKNNLVVEQDSCIDYLRKLFISSQIRGLFTACFDDQMYDYANKYYQTSKYIPIRHCWSIIGITKAMQVCQIHNWLHNISGMNALNSFEEKSPYQTVDVGSIIEKAYPFLAARIDIKLLGASEDEFQIGTVSDERAKLTSPEWFQGDGRGYVIESYQGECEIRLKSIVEGMVSIDLRGVDIKDQNSPIGRIPYWIDFTSLIINDEKIFDEEIPVWHNKAYHREFNASEHDEIVIAVSWKPHHD